MSIRRGIVKDLREYQNFENSSFYAGGGVKENKEKYVFSVQSGVFILAGNTKHFNE